MLLWRRVKLKELNVMLIDRFKRAKVMVGHEEITLEIARLT